MYSIFMGNPDNSYPSSTNPGYINVISPGDCVWQASEVSAQAIVPINITVRNLTVNVGTSPGTNRSVQFMLRKNGANTGVFVTISGAGSSGFTDSQVSFVAGDTIDLASTPTNSPIPSASVQWSMLVNSDIVSAQVVTGTGGLPSNSATNWNQLFGAGPVFWTPESDVNMVMPCAGTFSLMYINSDTAPGGTASYAFTMRKNGSNTTLTTTMTGLATTAHDLTHSFTVAAGDLVNIQCVPTGTPTSLNNVNWSMAFTPTTVGNSFFGLSSLNADDPLNTTGVTSWWQSALGYSDVTDVGAEEMFALIPGNVTLSNFYVSFVTAPGSSKSWTFTIRKNLISTALTTTITGAATTGNATANVTFGLGDLFTIIAAPAGTPTYQGALTMSYTVTFATPGQNNLLPFLVAGL